jgi:hypothetical protein
MFSLAFRSVAVSVAAAIAPLPIYLREGISYVWLVDPIVRMLEAFKLDASAYQLLGVWSGSALVRVEPFDAFELDPSALWSR